MLRDPIYIYKLNNIKNSINTSLYYYLVENFVWLNALISGTINLNVVGYSIYCENAI